MGPGYMHFLLVLLHVLNAEICAKCSLFSDPIAITYDILFCSLYCCRTQWTWILSLYSRFVAFKTLPVNYLFLVLSQDSQRTQTDQLC